MGLNVSLQEPQNHVIFVFDASYSMKNHAEALVQLFDNEVAFLAKHSKDLNQETRVSVYLFSSRGTARCVIYDMDVLRLPSLKGIYKPDGNTALCDATVLAVNDLKSVTHKYGQHSYWVMVFTDGFENDSTSTGKAQMRPLMASLPDEWTVSIFVPDQISKKYAKDWGFPSDNISVWDSTSVRGFEEMGKTVRKASETYFQLRSSGAKGTKNLFSLNQVSTDTIKRTLTPIKTGYSVVQHSKDLKTTIWIRDLVEAKLYIPYKRGYGYYELVKNEHIRPAQSVIIEQGGQYFTGIARDLLGLPGDETVKVAPDHNPAYKIFVQSQSHNRNIIPGQRVLYLTGNIFGASR